MACEFCNFGNSGTHGAVLLSGTMGRLSQLTGWRSKWAPAPKKEVTRDATWYKYRSMPRRWTVEGPGLWTGGEREPEASLRTRSTPSPLFFILPTTSSCIQNILVCSRDLICVTVFDLWVGFDWGRWKLLPSITRIIGLSRTDEVDDFLVYPN